jgi:hypothetical protein
MKTFMTIDTFIKKRPYLFWSTKNYGQLSKSAVVEAVLNYADLDDIETMIKIFGRRVVTGIFQTQITGKRCNYRPEIKNYFQLYFRKYA